MFRHSLLHLATLFPFVLAIGCGDPQEGDRGEGALRQGQANAGPIWGIYTNPQQALKEGEILRLVLTQDGRAFLVRQVAYRQSYVEDGKKKTRKSLRLRRQHGTYTKRHVEFSPTAAVMAAQGDFLHFKLNTEEDYSPTLTKNPSSLTLQFRLDRDAARLTMWPPTNPFQDFTLDAELVPPCLEHVDCAAINPIPAFASCTAALASCIRLADQTLITREQEATLELLNGDEALSEELDELAPAFLDWVKEQIIGCIPHSRLTLVSRKLSHMQEIQDLLADTSRPLSAKEQLLRAYATTILNDPGLKDIHGSAAVGPVPWVCTDDFRCVQYCPQPLP